MDYKKAIVKFNGGRGALLCNSCRVILCYGLDHPDKEYLCQDCRLDQEPDSSNGK